MLARIPDPEAWTGMSGAELRASGLDEAVATRLVSDSAVREARNECRRAADQNARIIDIQDPVYPRLLLETADPPLVLYVQGERWDPDRPHIAVVGTRKPSPYGLDVATRLASGLAARGIVVVSGLARGIDTASHEGALETGTTIAVFGTGIDRVYPAENRRLAREIVAKGAVLTEFPLTTPPLPRHFPQRNRILAGMCLGTVVVEAEERSGSLVTARLALESNREVFAVPGPVHSVHSQGPHLLIRQGACLVTGVADVLEELPGQVLATLGSEEPETEPNDVVAGLTPVAITVANALSRIDAITIDTLIGSVDLPVGTIYEALLELELAGMIRQLPGERYVRRSNGPGPETFERHSRL